MKKFRNCMVAVIIAWVGILCFDLADAQEMDIQKPMPILGATYQKISAFYIHKPVTPAFIVKPKSNDYCPVDPSDYQCPMDATGDGLNIKRESIQEARRVFPNKKWRRDNRGPND